MQQTSFFEYKGANKIVNFEGWQKIHMKYKILSIFLESHEIYYKIATYVSTVFDALRANIVSVYIVHVVHVLHILIICI